MEGKKECPFCGKESFFKTDYQNDLSFFECPVCGRFELKACDEIKKIDFNKAASYIFYNKFISKSFPVEYRYHTLRSKEECDKFNDSFEKGVNDKGRPVHMDNDLIEAWYPKTFSERVDYIINYLGTHTEHIGQRISFSSEETFSLLFIDRYENVKSSSSVPRNKEACTAEARYMIDTLKALDLINFSYEAGSVFFRACLTAQGYAKVDEIQRNTAAGKQVLVAMKFSDDTNQLREAIRKGITNAGYVAVFIDEVQHNDFITPELLKHIRDSKFVVADLTHKNNGAYFEEGYAMGLGKPVIQLCKKNRKLHFDIAQKNTIMWQTEDDIPEILCNRIKATIN